MHTCENHKNHIPGIRFKGLPLKPTIQLHKKLCHLTREMPVLDIPG